jgi:sulfur carrier protein ThiS adenylyltransferase
MVTHEEIQAALLERHGAEVSRKLAAGRVAVCGLGGLGSNIAVSLVRAGVGHLHLIDFDRVDITNLNRQQYFARHVGMPKPDALREVLTAIDPGADLRTDFVKITEDNMEELLGGDAVICEAFDRADQKAMLVSGAMELFPEKPVVSGSGMAGYGSANTIKTRRVSRSLYICGDGVTEPAPGAGLMAPRVAACAAHEANMVIRLLLGETEP